MIGYYVPSCCNNNNLKGEVEMEKMKIESLKNDRSFGSEFENISFSYGFGVGDFKGQAKGGGGGGCCCCCCCCCGGGSADTKQ